MVLPRIQFHGVQYDARDYSNQCRCRCQCQCQCQCQSHRMESYNTMEYQLIWASTGFQNSKIRNIQFRSKVPPLKSAYFELRISDIRSLYFKCQYNIDFYGVNHNIGFGFTTKLYFNRESFFAPPDTSVESGTKRYVLAISKNS